MKRVKLFAAPHVVRVASQARDCDLFQRPVALVQSLPRPLSVDHRVAKRSAMRCANPAPVVGILIRVAVTFGAGREGGFSRFEFRSAMLSVTSNATYPGHYVRLDDRRDKRFRVVTLRTILFHTR